MSDLKPVTFPGVTFVLGEPPNWDDAMYGQCAGLPVQYDKERGVFASCWTLTFRQRLAVLFGRPLWLFVVSRAHPPVMLTVADAMLAAKGKP
jgi:hypothetical protein